MMPRIFLATTGQGLARATYNATGEWSVESLLSDQDIRCLTSAPHNPNVVYAGTQGNGVLSSRDGGKTWQPSGLAGQIVKALAISRIAPGTVYAGLKPPALFVSRNGGETWTELEAFRHIPWHGWWFSPAESDLRAYVQGIALSPTDPKVIVAGIEAGAVVRTEDGGQTWEGHRPGALRDCHSLIAHAANGDWMYEAGGTGVGEAAANGPVDPARSRRSGRPSIWTAIRPAPPRAA